MNCTDHVVRTFTYPTMERARTAAVAWAAAYGDCEIVDRTQKDPPEQ
jgi:hypothetical protein